MQLAVNHLNRVSIALCGGIDPLVSLLRTGTPAAREVAACALWYLGVNNDNKIAIAQAGGVPALVQLLQDPALGAGGLAKEAAAKALWNLAVNNDNKVGRMTREGAGEGEGEGTGGAACIHPCLPFCAEVPKRIPAEGGDRALWWHLATRDTAARRQCSGEGGCGRRYSGLPRQTATIRCWGGLGRSEAEGVATGAGRRETGKPGSKFLLCTRRREGGKGAAVQARALSPPEGKGRQSSSP